MKNRSNILARRKKNYKFSKKSEERLLHVHPNLVRVAYKALEISLYDFGITEGLRTLERQRDLIKRGKSWTLASKHLEQVDGYSHAIDIVVLDEKGRITWEAGYYRKVIQAFMTAAIELGIQIESGGLWKNTFDGPHFQLNQDYL